MEGVILKEKPDGVLVSMGGQTALNCGVELHNAGVSALLLPEGGGGVSAFVPFPSVMLGDDGVHVRRISRCHTGGRSAAQEFLFIYLFIYFICFLDP